MNSSSPRPPARPLVAIACGGTGGHLFPGLAVGEELLRRGCQVQVLVSPKAVDRLAVTAAVGMTVATLPAVGLSRGQWIGFLRGFVRAYIGARRLFRARAPQAVLAMGGFTSAPPVLAGIQAGAVTFLHESNIVPGRANRWLAHVVHQAFVGFPGAAGRLQHTNVVVTGTPVRPQFQPAEAAACRVALGLHPQRPLLLVMGGSQGASGVNDLVLRALPQLVRGAPELQFLHLTGPHDTAKVEDAYRSQQARAVVRPFLTEMELALGAATLALSRAGASSLAELAAMRVPAVLIPYPVAADNHQLHNARAYVDTGASTMLEERDATGERLAAITLGLLQDAPALASMRAKLAAWHRPDAAPVIADKMLWLMRAHGCNCPPPQAPPPAASESAQAPMPSARTRQPVGLAGPRT
ncbi:MAG TPA: undecaprenyldiphospho-muramoylpentapeptide beta-N-acetylglucosaminyltransferase [Methylomirabilota bacterium]|nr:undecaprenyldiphospho-muramoylpentapeptide beta-N-acetylglucosaminyltransferase [Methylomirabilota bacterium]